MTDPRTALLDLFGFPDFRPGQRAAVEAALSGRDALVVMPTGAGKSLCYQLPALMREELTVVVSPLVSLMQDQTEALARLAPGRVALINAQAGGAANAETVRAARAGAVRLLYVAPERFASPGFAEAMRQIGVGLFVVDEAHCVSHWGHDFRPDYFALADHAEGVGARTRMALTATATPQVAADIARRLRLRDPVRVATGFDRPNLSFTVAGCGGEADKRAQIVAALTAPGATPAIVYAGTRAACDALARALSADGPAGLGRPVTVYHAGLDRSARGDVQRRFMDGEADVIVATNAFGMGVDKADVRTVIHATVPGSLEALYQESGRAGRDGRPAACLLLAEPRDKGLHVFFIQRSRVEDGAFLRVAETLTWSGLGGRYDVPLTELAAAIGGKADEDTARAVVGHLTRAGVLAPLPAPPDRVAGQVLTGLARGGLARSSGAAREAERVRWSQYRAVWAYVEGDGCRRRAMLAHFGDRPADTEPREGCCDVCDPGLRPAPPARPPARVARAARAARAGGRGGAPAPVAVSDGEAGELDRAILRVVATAEPAVGRTRAVEILRGGRSKVVAEHGYDALAEYGAFAALRSDQILGRIDALIAAGRLRSTGGRFPKLAVGDGTAALVSGEAA